ncbi:MULTISPECIES: hypothetical protein [Sinorhizobium]|uniref:hypothetical protein n=1 Tax=Sinorhizobium TaxID=28105 RepID=UPI0013E2E046|nr:hypothetical protein [Sinorhizobium medicae]MDW9532275.1 hypothetical protein [Sinorhizobium meliloti]UWU09419.1 hypothetical protein N2598_06670 [Sinorhizobium medicae]
MNDHTNENLPSDLRVKRDGDSLILFTRTAVITLDAARWREVVAAITEVSS